MSGRHGKSHKGKGRHAQAATQAAAAAAAEQARQQLLKAALTVAPKHTYDSDDENDEDFAEFRQQAAQLAGQAKLPPVLPDGLDPGKFATALQQLQQHLGITQEVASDALLATAEQHWNHYETWIEEAQIFLAMRQETDIEAQKMAEAMAASIHEREQRRRQEEQSRPELTNLSEERLRMRFAGSPVLDQLSAVVPGAVLFCNSRPLFAVTKCQLVALLRLEERCCKWWPQPGTFQYFRTFAERCVPQLQLGIATRSSCTHIDGLRQAHQHQQQQVPKAAAADQRSLQTSPTPQQPHQQQEQRQEHVLQQQGQVQAQPLDFAGQQLLEMNTSVMKPPAVQAVGLRAPSVESDSRAGDGSQLSTGSAAAAGSERRQSSRKRQVPERYRSVSPQVGAQQQKVKVRKTPPAASPHGAVCGASCSSEPPSKLMRPSSAVDVGSKAFSELAAPAEAAAGAAGTSAVFKASSQQLVSSLPMSATAGCSACCAAAAADGCTSLTPGTVAGVASATAVDVALQQQLDQLQQSAEAAGDACSSSLGSLVYQAAVVQQLSHVLLDEAAALQAMIYSMPPVAGAVPEIFRSDDNAAAAAAADADGSSSDVEITAECVVPPPGAPAAPTATPTGHGQQAPLSAAANPAVGNGEGPNAAEAPAMTAVVATAVTPPVPEVPPDSPPPRIPEYHRSFFTAGDFERSPSIEIISD